VPQKLKKIDLKKKKIKNGVGACIELINTRVKFEENRIKLRYGKINSTKVSHTDIHRDRHFSY